MDRISLTYVLPLTFLVTNNILSIIINALNSTCIRGDLMMCPYCGTTEQSNFLYCPHCGYKMDLEVEQPIPNWRQLPGFRSKKSWKIFIAVIIYVWIIMAIIASLFSNVL